MKKLLLLLCPVLVASAVFAQTADLPQAMLIKLRNGRTDTYVVDNIKKGTIRKYQIEDLLGYMTLEEKVGLCSGDFTHFKGVPRLDIPDVEYTDGPRGPNATSGTTAFPSGVLFGATWNPEVVEKAGAVMGEEARALNKGILLGPACNILRDPLCGRFFEYYTEDPCLNSTMAVAHVKGIQSQGVAACLKHYACNNREANRNDYMSIVDNRTMHEIYLPAFKAAVQQGNIQTVMTSANGMNDEFVSDSRKMLTDILKNRWGFNGFVMTDWLQTRSTEKAALAGLDVSMPGGDDCGFGKALLDAVRAGRVPVSVIDDKVRRILRVYEFVGALSNEDRSAGADVSTPAHQLVAQEAASQGIVLLKNENNALPLCENTLNNVLVVGPNADKRFCMAGMGGSSAVASPYEVTVLKGIENLLGKEHVTYVSSDELGGFRPLTAEVSPDGNGFTAQYFASGKDAPVVTRMEKSIDFMWEMKSPVPEMKAHEFREARFDIKFMPTVSGKYSFRFTAGGGVAYVYKDLWGGAPVSVAGTSARPTTADLDLIKGQELHLCVIYQRSGGDAAMRIEWQGPETDLADSQWQIIDNAATAADAVVFVGGIDHSLDTEGRDRLTLSFPEFQTKLIKRLSGLNKCTNVVLINGSPLEIGEWLPDVASVIEAWYPGMEGGTAIANILFGRVNPSGRLPFTWPKKLEDAPSHKFGQEDDLRVVYSDSLNVGYRYFDTADAEPLFTFGYGLSYTTFDYSNLTLKAVGANVTGKVSVANSGPRDGYETVQVYVRPLKPSVKRPHHELKWFRKVSVRAGHAIDVAFELTPEAFSYYDVTVDDWKVDPGKYVIEVCRDSRTPILTKEVEITN